MAILAFRFDFYSFPFLLAMLLDGEMENRDVVVVVDFELSFAKVGGSRVERPLRCLVL